MKSLKKAWLFSGLALCIISVWFLQDVSGFWMIGLAMLTAGLTLTQFKKMGGGKKHDA
jgi:hypothetical protein